MKRGASQVKRYVSIMATLLILTGAAATSVASASASSAVALDGSASNGCGYVVSCSVTLTTTQSPDIVIVSCDCFPYGISFAVTDTAGLDFTAREPQLAIGGNQFIQTWYAISSSPLTSDKISIETSDSGETWYGMMAFAVSGANTASPFASGFPISQANLACSTPCNTGVSAPADTFVFQVGGDTGSKLQTAGPGMTLIQASKKGQDAYAQYEILSNSISSVSLAFGTAQGSDFGVIADAINPGTASSSSSTVSSSTITSTSTASSGNPPALDGSAATGCGYVTSCSVALTTSQPNDVIIVGCDCFPSGASFSVKDTDGLTFNPREPQLDIGGNQFLQTWYAVSSVPLSSDEISVTTTNQGETWYGMMAFAVSGGNTAGPFVPGFPVSQANIACTAPCNTGVSAPADTFVFQVGGDTGSKLQTAGPGMTLIQASKKGQDAYAQFLAANSPISGATLSFGSAQSSDFGVIADALEPASTPTTTTTTSTTSSSTSSISSSSSSSSTTAQPTLAIDGSTSVVSYGVSSITTTVTTSHSNDVVILYISTGEYASTGCGSLPAPPAITNVQDGGSLTWHQRSAGTTTVCEVSPGPTDTGYGFLIHLEEWYTIAPAALISDVITISAAFSTSEIQDIEFGVSGANTQSPFDASSSLPCIATGYSFTPQCTLSTDSSTSMIIMGVAGPNGEEPNPGYSLILYSAEKVQDMSSEYQNFASPQSGINVGFTAGWDTDIANGNDTWVVIGDAVQAASQTMSVSAGLQHALFAPTRTHSLSLSRIFSAVVTFISREFSMVNTFVKLNGTSFIPRLEAGIFPFSCRLVGQSPN